MRETWVRLLGLFLIVDALVSLGSLYAQLLEFDRQTPLGAKWWTGFRSEFPISLFGSYFFHEIGAGLVLLLGSRRISRLLPQAQRG